MPCASWNFQFFFAQHSAHRYGDGGDHEDDGHYDTITKKLSEIFPTYNIFRQAQLFLNTVLKPRFPTPVKPSM